MKRIIKITEKQLKETEGDAFEYLDINNDVPYGNNSEINATGKVNSTEYGIPTIGDKISDTMTNQMYNRFFSNYSGLRPFTISETDNNRDNIDDFYNHDELDILSNGDENDNLIKISRSAEIRTEQLLKQIENLQPKQQAIILNKIIETLDLNEIPFSWKKELIFKLTNKN